MCIRDRVRIAEHLQVVETIDGDELDRLLRQDGSTAPKPVTPVKKTVAGAARIAAAEADTWQDGDGGSVVQSDDAPPVAAS